MNSRYIAVLLFIIPITIGATMDILFPLSLVFYDRTSLSESIRLRVADRHILQEINAMSLDSGYRYDVYDVS